MPAAGHAFFCLLFCRMTQKSKAATGAETPEFCFVQKTIVSKQDQQARLHQPIPFTSALQTP